MFTRILTVCTGNICRSPMAEGYLLHCLKENYPDVYVSSAGVHALVGRPAEKLAQEICASNDIDISKHIARQINEDMIVQNDLILVVEEEHRHFIEQKYPMSRGRVYLIRQWLDQANVFDPFREPKNLFESSYQSIKEGLDSWCKKCWPKAVNESITNNN